MILDHKGIRGNEEAEDATLHGHKPKFKIPYQDFQVDSKCSLQIKYKAYLEHSAKYKRQLYDQHLEITKQKLDSTINNSNARRSL